MRHMLTLITGNWVQPCRRREFWFVTCSRQVTVCISPHRQAIDEILTRKNTERTVGVNYCDIFPYSPFTLMTVKTCYQRQHRHQLKWSTVLHKGLFLLSNDSPHTFLHNHVEVLPHQQTSKTNYLVIGSGYNNFSGGGPTSKHTLASCVHHLFTPKIHTTLGKHGVCSKSP